MEEKQKQIEIKVRLHHINHGDCMEVWEAQEEKGKARRYFSRDDGFGVHEWYTLCDAPYGYCERDCHVGNHVTFIICDKQWNELFRDGPDKELFPESFPSLEEACAEAWSKVVKSLPHITRFGFDEWILKQSFRPLNQTEEANWRHCYYETVASETLFGFFWLGEEYGILRVTQQHTKCDARWYEYYAGKIHKEEYEGYTRFFAYEYHERHIGDVLQALGKRLNEINNAAVESHYENYGHTMSYFMDEFVGYDLSYEQVNEVKESRLRKARDDYNEANAYYYKLKENEESIRGIEAMLYYMRQQINKTKK